MNFGLLIITASSKVTYRTGSNTAPGFYFSKWNFVWGSIHIWPTWGCNQDGVLLISLRHPFQEWNRISLNKYGYAGITTNINNLSFFWIVSLILSEVHQMYNFPIFSQITYVLIAWVGVNSRWGSIVSISEFD